MIVVGRLPYWVASENDARHLDGHSFTRCRGRVPVNERHWITSEYTCTHPASYAVGPTGLIILHRLDLGSTVEQSIAQTIANGHPLYYSIGLAGTPEETRRQVLAHVEWYDEHKPWRPGEAMRGFDIQHVAYTSTPAIRQPPIKMISGALMPFDGFINGY